MGTTIASTPDAFEHPALFYADPGEYLAATVPYVLAGLDAGEPVLVAVPRGNLDRLREALGPYARRVDLRDMTRAGRNPGRIIPTVLLAFAAAHAGRRVRIIGEPIWAGRTPEEYPACAQHEALINAAFAGRNASILCPYDVRSLDPAWIDDAVRTHPELWTTSERWDSPDYPGGLAAAATFNLPLPGAPAHAATTSVDFFNLGAVRQFVAERGAAAGLPLERVMDLTVAVNELASNTAEHSGTPGELAMWTEDRNVVCQVTDGGHIADPLAGRVPVPPDAPTRGRGLLLVHQLCDLVRIHTTSAGTTIRVQMAR
ncbi:MAG TPA: sensor histidine kinase [Micromonosporaceae bacterium]|nr:sensor histidine kinase [Micromonosporaceae bacterium]